MKHSSFSLFLAFLLAFSSCQKAPQHFKADQAGLRYSGRVDLSNPAAPVLTGSASAVEMAFSGDSVQVFLQKLNPAGEHNYVALELDGEYMGRLKLEKDTMEAHTVVVPPNSSAEKHVLKVYKATESANGNVLFGGVKAMKLNELPPTPQRSIEFIGNSITCGMGVDDTEIPCGSGVWYDQHNAYLAYGPRVARALDANYILSCVSGIGMYRNWNSLEPVMPDVYENTYLNTDSSEPWDFSAYQPELVSIALGTNDFSDGDGIKERLPFDSARFVTAYIDFVKVVYEKYPDAQLALISSPMVSGEKGVLFENSLIAVKQHFRQEHPEKKPVAVFNFESIVPHGCDYHPDKNDHAQMAEALIPFYQEVMGW